MNLSICLVHTFDSMIQMVLQQIMRSCNFVQLDICLHCLSCSFLYIVLPYIYLKLYIFLQKSAEPFVDGGGWLASRGKQGCRNVRAGGDNVKPHLHCNGPSMCYFVYRSFKVKPN